MLFNFFVIHMYGRAQSASSTFKGDFSMGVVHITSMWVPNGIFSCVKQSIPVIRSQEVRILLMRTTKSLARIVIICYSITSVVLCYNCG